jgi:hypothetical protein
LVGFRASSLSSAPTACSIGLGDRDADHASNAGAFAPAPPHYAIIVSRGHFAQSERFVLDHGELLAQTSVLSLLT